MAIEFTCPCGAPCSADESQVGQLIHCEACGLDIPVPSHEEVEAADREAHDRAAEEMIQQVADMRGEDAAAAASRHEEDLETLRHEVSDGDEEERAARKQDAIRALHDQLGSEGGIAEMAEQMQSVREQQRGPGVESVAVAGLGTRPRRPPTRRPPTGAARAAHHIGFKRAMWLPSLGVGLVCLGLGLYCFVPSSAAKYEKHWEYFQKELKRSNIGEFEIVTHMGKAWAIPKGATHSTSATGRVYYQNVKAYGKLAPDELAVPADDYVNVQNHESGEQSRYFSFGVGLVLVGAVLTALSLWMHHDVRVVRRAQAKEDLEEEDEEEEEEEEGPGETEPASEPAVPADDVAEPAEEAEVTVAEIADESPAEDEETSTDEEKPKGD